MAIVNIIQGTAQEFRANINANFTELNTKLTSVTSVSGILKGNGAGTFSAAVAGTDYVIPSGSITGNAANVTGTVTVSHGGTGSTSASGARSNLGAASRYSGSATLTVAGWSGSAAPFTQAVACSGVLATDTPRLNDVTGTDLTAGAVIDEAWLIAVGSGVNPQTSSGYITFYASEKPSSNVPFTWEGTR